jgi:hypothetical protein
MNKGDQGTKNYNSKEVLLKSTKPPINPCISDTYAVDPQPDWWRVSRPSPVGKSAGRQLARSSAAVAADQLWKTSGFGGAAYRNDSMKVLISVL